MLDNGLATNFGDKATRRTLAAAGVKDEARDLFDVVQLHTGAYDALGLLLFVPRPIAAAKTLVVRVLDSTGNETDRVVVSAGDLLNSGTALPPNWVDPIGPWAGGVDDLVQWANATPNLPAYVKVPPATDPGSMVEIGLTTPSTSVEPGVTPVNVDPKAKLTARYFVAAIGMVSAAEVARHDWDQHLIDQDHDIVTNAVGPDSSDHALLEPGSRYRIVVEYFATRKSDTTKLGDATHPRSQTFWFRTDTIAADPADNTKLIYTDSPAPVPVRLDPWTMMTMPDDNEKGWFGREKLRLVFNTHDVDRFFGAYGKELRLRLEAANGQHPEGTTTTPHPLPIVDTNLIPIAATLLSPWDQALTDAVGRGVPACIDVDEHAGPAQRGAVRHPAAPLHGVSVRCRARRPGRRRIGAAGRVCSVATSPPAASARSRDLRGHCRACCARRGRARWTHSPRCCRLSARTRKATLSTPTSPATKSNRSAYPTIRRSSSSGSSPAPPTRSRQRS